MSEMRNPIKRNAGFNHPSGNVMTELQEADLNKFVAGAGETRDSGGVLARAQQSAILALSFSSAARKTKR